MILLAVDCLSNFKLLHNYLLTYDDLDILSATVDDLGVYLFQFRNGKQTASRRFLFLLFYLYVLLLWFDKALALTSRL